MIVRLCLNSHEQKDELSKYKKKCALIDIGLNIFFSNNQIHILAKKTLFCYALLHQRTIIGLMNNLSEKNEICKI